MKFDFFELIRAFTSLQLLMICLILLVHKTTRRHNKILTMTLFAQASYIICGVFNGYQHYIINQDLQIIFYILYSFIYLIGPGLYFYVRFIIDKDLKLKRKHFSHFALFFIVLIVNPVFLKIPSTDIFFFNKELIPSTFIILAILILHLQILGYIGYTVYKLYKYQYSTNYSLLSIKGRNRIKWIRFMLLGFLFIWLLESFIYFTYAYFSIILCETKIFLAFSQFVIINTIVFLGLNKAELLNADPSKIKYQKNLIKIEDRDKYKKRLLQFMDTESPYLDPLLTLSKLSEKTGIPTNHISQILNIDLQKTFYDFVNAYRIEYFKKHILSSLDQKMTILEVMYESGFNSKSVFNNSFKKVTGLTPSEYKRKNNS